MVLKSSIFVAQFEGKGHGREVGMARGQGSLREYRFNAVPGIADAAHVNESPNPGAALGTSPIRPDSSSSRGFVTTSRLP